MASKDVSICANQWVLQDLDINSVSLFSSIFNQGFLLSLLMSEAWLINAAKLPRNLSRYIMYNVFFLGGRTILMQHIKDNHQFIDLFNCMNCKAKFSFYFEYINHMSGHQTGGNLQMLCPCDICGVKFLGKTKYR